MYDVRFKSNSTITIAGPSQSGKSTLVKKLVQMKDDLFTEPFSHVYWFCAYLPKTKLEGVKYSVGLPINKFNEIPPHSLVILDDYMSELSKSSELTNLMTKAVHHLPMTLIYITQNMFQKGNDVKTRRMNTNYLIIFKNPHDRAQVDYIGRQMYPNDMKFLTSVYTDVTSKEPFSYILIDTQQETPDEIRVRSKITEKNVHVYVPHSIALYI